mgnify:CR=1 FL=1
MMWATDEDDFTEAFTLADFSRDNEEDPALPEWTAELLNMKVGDRITLVWTEIERVK